jgi:hypothetical protein
MAGGGDYQRYCQIYQDISGSYNVAVGGTTATLVTNSRSRDSIFIQKLHIEVTAGAAQTWTIRDTAGTPINFVPSVSTTAIAHFDFDFGPKGISGTVGTNLELLISAAGAIGWVSWEGYQRQTSTGVPQ